MNPNEATDAPMACMNWGSTAVAISWQKSLKKLVRLNRITLRFSQRFSVLKPGSTSGIIGFLHGDQVTETRY
jgi:hypothetical protein